MKGINKIGLAKLGLILVLDLWLIGLSCGWDSFNRYRVQGNCKNLFLLVSIVFIHITLVAFLWYDCPAQMFIVKYFSWKIVGLIFSLYLWFLFVNPFPNPFIRTYINCKTFYNVTDFSSNNFNGTLPMQLGMLTSLQQLWVIYIYMYVCMYVYLSNTLVHCPVDDCHSSYWRKDHLTLHLHLL